MNNSEFFRGWRDRLTETKDIAPLNFGMTQEEAIAILGEAGRRFDHEKQRQAFDSEISGHRTAF